jgi:hypothetical protein
MMLHFIFYILYFKLLPPVNKDNKVGVYFFNTKYVVTQIKMEVKIKRIYVVTHIKAFVGDITLINNFLITKTGKA